MRVLNPNYKRTIIDAANRCPYFTLLSMRLVDFDFATSLMELDACKESHFQPFGVVHGGVFSSIVDAAAFWAVYAELDDEVGMTSVDLKLNYLAPAGEGKLIARGKRVKLGKTLGLGEATVSDADGRLLCHGTSTLIALPTARFQHQDGLPPKFID
jgi:uncharacterized protein (TIGR00369 family)